jgi:hypothetical protein
VVLIGRLNFSHADSELKGACREALFEWGQLVLGDAVQEVPLEEGTLMRSGDSDVDPMRLEVAVWFDTPYAIPQHENLGYRHDNGRKAKYLEDPVNRHSREFLNILAKHVKQVIG